MKRYVFVLVLLNLFIGSTYAQQVYNSTYSISEVDSVALMNIPELKVPDLYKGSDSPSLPDSHDNSVWPYLRPAFYQNGYSCGQASSVGYNFTYEINRARDLSADSLENQYPPDFTWNFDNKGENNQGVCFLYSLEAIKLNGQPNSIDFEGMGTNHRKWMSGYDRYYNGMFNRLSDVYSVNIGDPEGVTTLKQWLYDHLEGSPYGGLANFYTDYFTYDYLPENTPEAGKCVVSLWGSGTGHSMTIIGWNDSIRFDYNEDGLYTNNIDINDDQVIDMKDWEIGGFKFINSFGEEWADSSFCYMMYKSVAEEKQDGGIWNKSAYVIDIKENYEPTLTFKVKLKHTARNKIKVRSGVSSDTTDAWPQHIHEFQIFNYQGGENYMQGNNNFEEDKIIEFGLDVTPLLSYIDPNQPAKFFLQINEYDPDFTAAGKIMNYSLFDYLNGGIEITYPDTNVAINNNGYTTLSVTHTLNPDLVKIDTEELPAFTTNQNYSFQMEASGGNPPYTWNILSLYNESQFTGEYPLIEDEELNSQGFLYNGRVTKDIEFEFPFYGENFSTITVHRDGILGFRDERLPIPYQVNDLYLFRYAPFVSPFYNRDIQILQSQYDKIWYAGNENFAAFRWDVSLDIGGELVNTDFCAIIYPDGKIEYYYDDFDDMPGLEWLTGVSAGDGVNYQLSEFSQTLTKGVQVIRYQPQNSLSSFELSTEGLFTTIPANDQSIYNIAVKVTDDDWITSTKQYQLSNGLIFDYTINSGDDNQVDYGETAFLDLTIKNISSGPISNIIFEADSDDPYITLNDNTENIGSINPGQTVTFSDAISFTVSVEVPNNYYLPFEVLLNSTLNTWKGKFTLKAHAPVIQMQTPNVINTEEGWLYPGETGNIIVPVLNMGHSTAVEVSGTILCNNSNITFNDPTTTYIGDLPKGEIFYDTINITIDEDCPQGINIVFNYEIEAYPNIEVVDSFGIVIGRYPVLLIDMDPDLASGPIVKNILDEIGVFNKYVNYIPEELNQYQNLFVFLGREFQYYTLTQADGETLSDFLLTYGNIYMEGGLTWAKDPQTQVHTKFNIDVETIGWSLTDPLIGVENTFTEDMNFNFEGELGVYDNYLIAIDPAFSILEKEENEHVFMIAYDEGTYKTVGSNIDLSGLVDGEHPSTKKNLLAKILIFFGQDVVITDIENINMDDPFQLIGYPNPLTSQSTIYFYLPQKDNIDLSIYNMKGQKVLTIASYDNLQEGNHCYKLNGNLLPQGVYYCMLTTKATKSCIKLVIVK